MFEREILALVGSITQAARRRGPMSRDGLTAWLLVAPAAVCIVFLFVVPIGYVLLLSVTDPTVSLEHYRRLLTVPLYANVMLNTFKTSFIVTLACLALGYPLAYVMARRNDAIAVILLAAGAFGHATFEAGARVASGKGLIEPGGVQ